MCGETVPDLYEVRVQRNDGTIIPIEVHSAPIEYDGKKGTITFRRDITDRKRIEEKLRESEEKFRHIAEGSFDPIILLDPNGIITYVSPAFYLMTGYAPDEVVGKFFTNYLPEEERVKQAKAFERVVGGEVVRAQESKFLGKDGFIVHTEFTFSPIMGDGGVVGGVEMIVRDVTERRKLAVLKDQFISAVTHELRTPLVSMTGYLDLLLSHPDQPPSTIKSHLQVVKRNTDRLLTLTNDLLDVQRMQAGRLQLNLQRLNLHEVIDQAVSEIRPLLDEKKQTLNVTTSEGPLLVKGDPVRLSQVFMNLLSNANKFAPEGGQIGLYAKKSQDATIIVQVSDNGIGVNHEDLERIFQPFASIKKPTYIKGTGLGLNISKGLVEAHGGKIWVESEGEGKGTTFNFTLPLTRES